MSFSASTRKRASFTGLCWSRADSPLAKTRTCAAGCRRSRRRTSCRFRFQPHRSASVTSCGNDRFSFCATVIIRLGCSGFRPWPFPFPTIRQAVVSGSAFTHFGFGLGGFWHCHPQPSVAIRCIVVFVGPPSGRSWRPWFRRVPRAAAVSSPRFIFVTVAGVGCFGCVRVGTRFWTQQSSCDDRRLQHAVSVVARALIRSFLSLSTRRFRWCPANPAFPQRRSTLVSAASGLASMRLASPGFGDHNQQFARITFGNADCGYFFGLCALFSVACRAEERIYEFP